MIAIRNQRRAVDLASYADAKHGDRLITQKSEDARRSEPPELSHWLRVDEPVDRLVASDKRAEENDKNDCDTGQILDPTKPVGEGRRWLAPCENERNPEGDCGSSVGEIVNRVGE